MCRHSNICSTAVRVLNLSNARGYSVKEVIAAAEKICGCAISVEVAARRPGDPAVLIGDASRAHTLLGWKPKRSTLEMQIADAWNWMKSRNSCRKKQHNDSRIVTCQVSVFGTLLLTL